MTEPADIARAFNEWTPGRKDLEIATLRARVDELERSLREIARMAAKLPSNGVGHDIYNCAVVTLAIRGNVPTPDPRDARIAEVEQAAIQWRLRMAELETEAQESDARIAVLEAELTLVEETATALGLKSMAASARRALEGRRLPYPRDARIAELKAALRDIERRGEAFRSAKRAIIADCVMDLDWCRERARRALGEEPSGG